MCGLVGIAGDLAYRDEITLKRLLVLDVFRGPDSTGFAAVRNSGDVRIAKVPSHPFDLFDMGRFKTALDGNNSKVFMGHNRFATRGAVTTGNAHPYQYEHIVGAHNGTLEHASVVALEAAVGERFAVDSQALIAGIAKLGVKNAIEMCHEGKDSASGAWALVWYDTKEETLNFLRNRHRPLWYSYTKDFKRIIWASEYPMIEAASHLGADTELFEEEKGSYCYFSADEDTHYKFDINELKKGSDKRPKPTARIIKGKEPLPVIMTGSVHRPFAGTGQDNIPHYTQTTHGQGTTPSTTTSHTSGIIHLIGDLHDPFAGLISKDRFDDMAKYGCAWCSDDVSWGDTGIMLFERDGVVMCARCVATEGEKDNNTRIYTKHELYL